MSPTYITERIAATVDGSIRVTLRTDGLWSVIGKVAVLSATVKLERVASDFGEALVQFARAVGTVEQGVEIIRLALDAEPVIGAETQRSADGESAPKVAPDSSLPRYRVNVGLIER